MHSPCYKYSITMSSKTQLLFEMNNSEEAYTDPETIYDSFENLIDIVID